MNINRIESLDGVRGLAIAGVLVVHCFLFPLSTALSSVTSMGGLGVDLFFVLSGYLITGILLRSTSDSRYFRDFYARRALRIFPAYYFILLITIFLLPLVSSTVRDAQLVTKLPWFLLYMQNWYMSLAGHPFAWPGVDHLWSLAIEEQFYFLWPLMVLLVSKGHFRTLCLMLIGLSLAAKLALAFGGNRWAWALYVSTPTRIDGLVYGAFIATLAAKTDAATRRPIRLLGLAGATALAGLIVTGPHLNSIPALVIGTTAATFAFGYLIFQIHTRSLSAPVLAALTATPLIWLGRYSYGIYLIHNIAYWLVWDAVNLIAPQLDPMRQNPGLMVVGIITIGVTLPLAVVMFKFIEAPALRQRHRFQPKASLSEGTVAKETA